jgi:hypothetical protein
MEKNKNPITEFPDKIDKLMIAIDKVNNIDRLIRDHFDAFFFRYTRIQNFNYIDIYINLSFAFAFV